MKSRRRLTRLWVRSGCFVLLAVLLWPLSFWPESSKYAVAASPFISICGIFASSTFSAAAAVGVLVAGISVFRKRWFCRYICPTGLLQDGVFSIRKRKSAWGERCPPVGRYLVVATVAGALFGYPLLLWMDPLAIFSSTFSIHTSANIPDAVLSVAPLIFLLLVALIAGDLWCARICPLGATQEFLADLKRLIRKKSPQSKNPEIGAVATRRAFLAIAAGAGFGLLAKKSGRARGGTAPLRPPGSVAEDTFPGLCVRCGNCVRACPSMIIRPDTGQTGIAGFLAPVVRFEKEYCLEDCNACTQVCPSGALQSLSLEQKHHHIIGEALVDGSICFLVQGKNDCDVCVRSCPFDAVEIYWNEELYVAYPNVDPGKCNGCGACEAYCPTGEIKAIRVWKSGMDQDANNSDSRSIIE